MTIISDDGDFTTGTELNNLAKQYQLRVTVAGVVNFVRPYLNKWKKIEDEGRVELISHSYTHLKVNDKTNTSTDKLKHEYTDSIDWYKNNFNTPTYTFIYPNNSTVLLGYDFLKTNGVIAVRQGERGYNSLRPQKGIKPGQWMNLYTMGIRDVNVTEKRNSWVDNCINNHQWLIEMWHNVSPQGGNTYHEITTAQASAHLAYIAEKEKQGKLWVAPFTEAVAYLYEKENYAAKAWQDKDYIAVQFKRLNNDFPYKSLKTKLTIGINLPEGWRKVSSFDPKQKLEIEIKKRNDLYVAYITIEPTEQIIRLKKEK